MESEVVTDQESHRKLHRLRDIPFPLIASAVSRCRVIILLVFLARYHPGFQAVADEVLTNAAQLRALTPATAAFMIPVRIEGVATFYNRAWGGFALQDGSGAVWVTVGSDAPFSAGARVRIRGKSGSGLFTPIVVSEAIEVAGVGEFPAAVEADIDDVFEGKWDVFRIRLRGLVESVASADGEFTFQLYSQGKVVKGHAFNIPAGLLQNHTEIEVAGVCTVEADDHRPQAINLIVTRAEDIRLRRQHPAALSQLAVTPLAALAPGRWAPAASQLYHVHAVVSSVKEKKLYTLYDGTNGAAVLPAETTRFAAGDEVDVLAVPWLGPTGLELVELESVRQGHVLVPAPRPLKAREAEGGRWNWVPVELEGKVLGNLSIDDRQVLLMRDGETRFLAVAEVGSARHATIDPGDFVLVRGILRPSSRVNAGSGVFEVQIHRPEDVVLLPKRESGAQLLLISVAVAVGAVAVVSVWALIVRRRAEKLRAAELQLQRQQIHVQRTPLGIIEWDPDLRVVSWNPAAERIFGWKAIDAKGQHASFLIPKERQQQILDAWTGLIQSRGSGKTALDNIAKDGQIIPCEWHNTVLIDGQEQAVGLASLVQDVTREHSLADELKRQAVEYGAVLSSLAEGILLADRQGNILASNPSAAYLLGSDQEELKRFNLFETEWHGIERDGGSISPFKELGGRCFMAGQAVTGFVCRLQTLDRRERWFSINVTEAELAGSKHASRAVFSLTDITDSFEAEQRRERLEVELHRAQKMEALGTLAGGVAHDFNNLLAMILGNAEILREDFSRDHPVYRGATEIANAAVRGASLVERILTFSRPQASVRAPILLSSVVKEVVSLLRPTLLSSVTAVLDVLPDECPVEADSGQMHQVFVNLCTNAIHAMGEKGGTLRITIKSAVIRAGSAHALAGQVPGPCLSVTIADTGPGIPPALLGRIFEPFFTTKAPGKGTGLGLSVVHGILKAHGASIIVRSEPGQGACFELMFRPASHAPLPSKPLPEELAPARKEGRRILLVDDEPGVLNTSGQMLEASGYRVRSTLNPMEALHWIQSEPGSFDVLVTDLSMPQMKGTELIDAARKLQAGLPAVLVSGFAGGLDAGSAGCPQGIGIVAKPFTRKVLLAAIESALLKCR